MKEKRGVDIFTLKIIGLVTMTMLNLSFSSLIQNLYIKIPLGVIGASSLTIFAFIITESYRHTSNLNKYLFRVLLIAVVSALPYNLVYGDNLLVAKYYFNSALTAFICITSLYMYDKMNSRFTRIFFLIFIGVISTVLRFEWAPFVIILTLLLHIFKDNKFYINYYIITGYLVIFGVSLYILISKPDYSNQNELIMNICQIGCILPLPLLNRYNGQLGRKLKWPLYIYYPVMLLVIYLLLKLK